MWLNDWFPFLFTSFPLIGHVALVSFSHCVQKIWNNLCTKCFLSDTLLAWLWVKEWCLEHKLPGRIYSLNGITFARPQGHRQGSMESLVLTVDRYLSCNCSAKHEKPSLALNRSWPRTGAGESVCPLWCPWQLTHTYPRDHLLVRYQNILSIL